MEIIMPKMGDAMTEGKVIRWYKKAGEAVKKGDPLLEIETDKVNLDLEAEQDGTLGDVSVQEGQMVPVGGRLAMILGAGEKASGEQRAASGNVRAGSHPGAFLLAARRPLLARSEKGYVRFENH